MPRYYYSGARDTVNGRKKISIFWLRRNGYFQKDRNYYNGGLQWSSNGQPTGDIRFEMSLDDQTQSPYIKFSYRAKQHSEPEENYKSYDYQFRLESVPCHFGGKRWFFICGLYKSGIYCGRRVAILYSVGNYFGCRYCAELSYDSCNESRRNGGIFGILGKSWKAEEYLATIRRTHYGGKPTRKYRKYLRMDSISDDQLAFAELALDKILGKTKPKKT